MFSSIEAHVDPQVSESFSDHQVRCPEEGCPPVETVITDLGVKAPRPGAGVGGFGYGSIPISTITIVG